MLTEQKQKYDGLCRNNYLFFIVAKSTNSFWFI